MLARLAILITWHSGFAWKISMGNFGTASVRRMCEISAD